MAQAMTPQSFVAKWSRAELSERAASQEHFLDLCRLLGQPTPAEHDATGAEYTFEKGVATADPDSGERGHGFADVWWKGKFAWEYKRKGKHPSLEGAYSQLCKYREALDNPPLMIVSDIARTEIHTNFTGTSKKVHTIALADLAEPKPLDLLRRAFTDPLSFRPTLTTERITRDVAARFADLAQLLALRGVAPHDAAHFLMKCMFCLFAEDVKLLPDGLFTRLLRQSADDPPRLAQRMNALFDAMRRGGDFGADAIEHFNGGLFDDAPAIQLTTDEAGVLLLAAGQDWSSVEPAIFGTLFERSLDPTKRSQIGAHYTSREDILLVIEPVIEAPLRREWDAVKASVEALIAKRKTQDAKRAKTDTTKAIAKEIEKFHERLGEVRVLDPACGSGNFLYVAIQRLLDLDKEVITFASRPDIALSLLPKVRPTQLLGVEINPYAAELAQVVIWIGYLQWMRANGFDPRRKPILEPIQSIERRDAILDWRDEKGKPTPDWRPGAACAGPAKWPAADFIVGNPPFLGSKLFRKSGLPDAYLEGLYAAFDLPKTSDLCCYWFELARRAIEADKHARAGLLATQGIRGENNRTVLERIKQSGDIFLAWSNREWVLDGAAVRVAIVGFAHGIPDVVVADGNRVACINPDLTSGRRLSDAQRIPAMEQLCFQGVVKVGSFELSHTEARRYLSEPAGPSGRAMNEVLKPWYNGQAVTRRDLGMWIIDFAAKSRNEASLYPGPFTYVEAKVKPVRAANSDRQRRENWWMLGRSGADMRDRTSGLARCLATVRVAKHRTFSWIALPAILDARLVGFARADDFFLGVLHSSVHELWSLRLAPRHGAGNDPTYNNTTCFETFPLPWPPGREPANNPLHRAIANAAKSLNELRERWLNPPEWLDPIAARIDAADDFADVPAPARPLIRRSAIMAAAAADPRLKKRTLTNLYNERPTWLRLAHRTLDEAVLAAYRATDPAGGWDAAWAEAWEETGAGAPLPAGHALAARRAEADRAVLEALLRLNLARSAGERPAPPDPARRAAGATRRPRAVKKRRKA